MSCYHRIGRTKKAWACQHSNKLHYSKGLCQNCYLAKYYRERKEEKRKKELRAEQKNELAKEAQEQAPVEITESENPTENPGQQVPTDLVQHPQHQLNIQGNVEDQIVGVSIQSIKNEQSVPNTVAETRPEAAFSMPTQINENNNVPTDYQSNVIGPMTGNSAVVGNF